MTRRTGLRPLLLVAFFAISFVASSENIDVEKIETDANRGNAEAQFKMGVILSNGVHPNYDAALKWYTKAAEQGHVGAQYNLGNLYFDGNGTAQDYEQAFKWYRKAAEQRFVYAESALAKCYLYGDGVSQNQEEAIKWAMKAAEQEFPQGQTTLGLIYNNGLGVPKNAGTAAKWFSKAAQQNEPNAQFFLGNLFLNGEGVPQDYVEAYKWFNLAAAQGLTNAITLRDSTAKKMTSLQIGEAQQRSSSFVSRKEATAESKDSRASDILSIGSGVIITEDGYLLTNFHVVEQASKIKIKTKQGFFPAKLVKADMANDIAVLKISGALPKGIHALPVAASRSVKLGDSVFTVGFPNTLVQGVDPKLTRGEINSLSGIHDDPRHFQISAAVQPGNSGGALVNACGNVIGIVTMRLDDVKTLQLTGSLPQNVNYALKSSFVSAFLETLPEVAKKLKEPNTKEREFEDVVKEAEETAAMVLVY